MTTWCFVLLFLSTYVVVKAAILTSDLGGTNTSVTVCPNQPITLTCQTSTSLAWFYSTENGQESRHFTEENAVNQTFQQDGIEFKLTHKNGNNFTSTAVVKTANGLNITCSPDGIANNPENSAISIAVKDIEIPPPPSNITVIDVQTDKILLHWDAVATADSYQVVISPNISGGSCDGGMCFFNVNSAILDHLEITTYMIDISSVNCAGSGNHSRIIQDTIPKAILTSDLGGTNTSVTVCPNQPITLTCQTPTSIIAWFYSTENGQKSRHFTEENAVNQTFQQDGIEFKLTHKNGNNFTSTAVVKPANELNITCNPDGIANNPDSSMISILVTDVLPPPVNLKINEVCVNHIGLQWTSHPSADGYKINVNPKPKSGICINGSCILERQCTTNKTCVLNETSIILDGLELQEYSFDVSTLNCAGIGNPTTIRETLTIEVPPVPEILTLTVDESDNDSVVFHMTWKPPVLNCRTPKIDNYTVIISNYGNSSREVLDSRFCCEYDVLLERCGLYTFQLEASNAAGTSISLTPKSESSEGLSQTVSISELKFDSVTIHVEVNECLRPAIINVTIVLEKTLERPEIYIITDPELVKIIKNLESDTMYNATVTVFYIENGDVSNLKPQTLHFTTPQDFSAFERIVIIVLSVGGFLGLAVMFLILLVGIFCLRNEQRKRELRKVKKRQSKIIATQKEIQENLKEYERNTAIQHNPPNIEVQAMQAPYKKLYPQLLTHDSTYM